MSDKTRRRRSERARKADHQTRSEIAAGPDRSPGAHHAALPARQLSDNRAQFATVISPTAHPSSVEFLMAYNAYFDRSQEPLSAAVWRESVLAGVWA